jgi:hypothetical protein
MAPRGRDHRLADRLPSRRRRQPCHPGRGHRGGLLPSRCGARHRLPPLAGTLRRRAAGTRARLGRRTGRLHDRRPLRRVRVHRCPRTPGGWRSPRRSSRLGDDGLPRVRRGVRGTRAGALAAAVRHRLVADGVGLLPRPDDGRARSMALDDHVTRPAGHRRHPDDQLRGVVRGWFRDRPRDAGGSGTTRLSGAACDALSVGLLLLLGSAVFFDRPGPAIIGGVAMGLVAFPLAWRLWVDRG